MEALPDLKLEIAPTVAELAAVHERIASIGGVHLDETCEGPDIPAEGNRPAYNPYCGNDTIYEIPYIRELPKLMLGTPAGRGTVRVCAVCDGLVLKPRTLARKVA